MTKKLLISFLILLLSTISVKGQLYNFHNYSVEHGIAQSQVYALHQDHRGFIWFGTRGGGLTRFDGIKFKTYTEKDGLSNNYVYDIVEDSKNNLWIATNNGLSYYNGIKFSNHLPSTTNAIQIYKIALDQKNNCWLATSKGLIMFDGKTFKNISKELRLPQDNVNAVFVDNDGTIYFGDSKGLYSLASNGKQLTNYASKNRYMQNAITSIKKDKQGNLWIGTYGDGAYCYDGKKFFRIDYHHELYNQTILDIFIDSKETIWFATLSNGVIAYQPSSASFINLSEREGLSNNHVRAIRQDNSGSYWFGTSGGGVCNYLGKQFTTYDKSSGLGGSFIYSIYRDSQKRLWIGNSQKGLSFYANGIFKNYHAGNGFEDVKVKAIIEGNDGILYIGTEGKGLYSLKDSTFRAIPSLAKTYIKGLAKDQKYIWVATAGNGLIRIESSDGDLHFTHFTVANGMLSNRLTSVFVDPMGSIWYGTENNGIGCITQNGNHLRKLTTKNGLSSNAIRSITADKKGFLWIGTAGSGVNAVSLKNKQSKPLIFNYKNGLTSTNIYLLTFDYHGNLIVGTERGLDYVYLTKQNAIRKIKHYNKGDGFTGVETCQNAVFNDQDGTIWFGTINGLIKFNPASRMKNTVPPIIQITDIKLFYLPLSKTPFKAFLKDWNVVHEMDLPFDQNHITFDFFAVNLSNPESVRYKWKLEGFDDHWSPASTDQSILYSNLNPGTYRFLVKASNEDGVWSNEPAMISFTIATPIWYRWWFILLEVVGIIALIYAAIRWRFNRLKVKSEEEKKKLQLEKEVVELEQKALRLQMNPHFIFNALNSIQSQIGTGNDKEARYYLAKFSRLMRQILDNSRNTTITLEEEINTLENYLLIEKFCNGDRFDYSIELSEKLEKDFIRIPPMIVQPFVENAIKHGMRNSDGTSIRGKIELHFEDKKQFILCTIIDNGIGREKAAELNKLSKETYHRSTALNVTQERLELMSDEEQSKAIEIIDLYENKLPSGTKVILRIPTI